MKNERPNDAQALPCVLPNGMAVFHVNKHETDFLYKEIFVDNVYLRHGITLPEDACVVDIGANIGMFTVFVKSIVPRAKVIACEPIPELCDILRRNISAYSDTVTVIQKGVSDSEKEARLTFYPGYSIMSGFHADKAGDASLLSSGIRQQLSAGDSKVRRLSDEQLLDIATHTLGDPVEIRCQMTTVSRIIRETRIERIDLLKIDAEKSELGILDGIEEGDWPRIQQIVLEAHSHEDADKMRSILQERGFETAFEQEQQLVNSGVFNCFAVRRRTGH